MSEVGGNIFFERGSWVSRVGPQVEKKKSLHERARKKKCDSTSTSVTAPGLVIG
jgi:hypothetical protein